MIFVSRLVFFTSIFFAPFLVPVTSYAENCLSNGNTINIGDSIEQVENACGEPDSSKNKTIPVTQDKEVTHWYYLTQFHSDNIDAITNTNTDSNSDQNTPNSIIRIVVQFNHKDQVSSLHIYTPTNIKTDSKEIDLLGYVILVGDSQEQVQDILGKPFDTKKLIKPEVVSKDHQSIWTYENENQDQDSEDNDISSQQFTFINNQLTVID